MATSAWRADDAPAATWRPLSCWPAEAERPWTECSHGASCFAVPGLYVVKRVSEKNAILCEPLPLNAGVVTLRRSAQPNTMFFTLNSIYSCGLMIYPADLFSHTVKNKCFKSKSVKNLVFLNISHLDLYWKTYAQVIIYLSICPHPSRLTGNYSAKNTATYIIPNASQVSSVVPAFL